MAEHHANGQCVLDVAYASLAGANRQQHRSNLAVSVTISIPFCARDCVADQRALQKTQPAGPIGDGETAAGTCRQAVRRRLPPDAADDEDMDTIHPRAASVWRKSME